MSKFLIIGSVATAHWAGLFHYEFRAPRDIDIMSNGIPFVTSPTPSKLLIENSWFGQASEYMMAFNKDTVFLDLDFMYTLKLSHACYNIKLDKTLSDMSFLKKIGAKVDRKLLDMLREHWLTVHGKPTRVSLDVTKEAFFTDSVNRKYDHDLLHEYCAEPLTPSYIQFLRNPDSPIFDSEKWNAGSYEEKLRSAVEEIAVTAVERHLVGKENVKRSDKLISIGTSYKQLVTTMTKGEFNIWMLDNRDAIMQSNKTILLLVDKILKSIEDNHGTK